MGAIRVQNIGVEDQDMNSIHSRVKGVGLMIRG